MRSFLWCLRAPEKQLNNDIYVVSSYIFEVYGPNSPPTSQFLFQFQHWKESLLWVLKKWNILICTLITIYIKWTSCTFLAVHFDTVYIWASRYVRLELFRQFKSELVLRLEGLVFEKKSLVIIEKDIITNLTLLYLS